jgi:hypothetical protein
VPLYLGNLGGLLEILKEKDKSFAQREKPIALLLDKIKTLV